MKIRFNFFFLKSFSFVKVRLVTKVTKFYQNPVAVLEYSENYPQGALLYETVFYWL